MTAAVKWALAPAIAALRAEVNTRWPERSKTSDGTIGDAAHASRDSDHNPWVVDRKLGPVVRAFDCTAEGIDAAAYAEHLRQLGKAGDPRLCGGGYVIFRGRIASERDAWAWREYTGENKHNKHVHVSLSRNADGYSSTAGWGVTTLAGGQVPQTAAASLAVPACPGVTRPGMGTKARPSAVTTAYQEKLKARGWSLTVDGIHRDELTRVLSAFQAEKGLKVDGVGGSDTWRALWTAPR